ncbi:hypothetical protein LRP88_11141 [Fusarium phalaenopsidis]
MRQPRRKGLRSRPAQGMLITVSDDATKPSTESTASFLPGPTSGKKRKSAVDAEAAPRPPPCGPSFISGSVQDAPGLIRLPIGNPRPSPPLGNTPAEFNGSEQPGDAQQDSGVTNQALSSEVVGPLEAAPTLSAEQQEIVDLLDEEPPLNIFFTGSAGCGKSTVLKPWWKN